MNILIVGLGSIARKHINAIKEIDISHKIYALRSSLIVDDEADVTNLFSYDEIFDYFFDFAIISNPTSEHKNAIEKLKKLGCPLFIEKPLYHLLSISDLVADCKNEGILTYVACNLRFLDSLNYIRQYIEENKEIINEVNVYCGSFLPEWRQTDYKLSYSSQPKLGGGVHLDLIHEIDYLYWLFGMPLDWQSVLTSRSTIGIESIDYANYCLIYRNFCASIILNYYRKDKKRSFEIVFENHTLTVDLINNEIRSINNDVFYKSNQTILDTYTAQMNYFIDIIVNKKNNSFNDISDAYNVLKICLGNDSER